MPDSSQLAPAIDQHKAALQTTHAWQSSAGVRPACMHRVHQLEVHATCRFLLVERVKCVDDDSRYLYTGVRLRQTCFISVHIVTSVECRCGIRLEHCKQMLWKSASQRDVPCLKLPPKCLQQTGLCYTNHSEAQLLDHSEACF